MTAEEHTAANLVLPGEVGLGGALNLGPKYHCQVEVRKVAHNGRGVARLKSYLSSVTGSDVRDGRPLGGFFDGLGIPVSPREVAHSWGNDKHHYRIAIELPFIQNPLGVARRVMKFAETNFMPTGGWGVAPVHEFSGQDTTNIFVVCRGADRHGEPLTVDPEVVGTQLRDAFGRELISELGSRTQKHVAREMVAEARRESVTGHDHQLASQAELSGEWLRIKQSDLATPPGSVRRREYLIARLERLKEFGFARETGRVVGPQGWEIVADFRRRLQGLAERRIICAQLWDKSELLDALPRAQTPRHVEGILVAKGPLNPLAGEHWVLVRRNDEHYLAKTWASNGLDQSEIGSAVALGRQTGPRFDAADSVLQFLGRTKGDFYTGALHHEQLSKKKRDPVVTRKTVEQAVSFVERAAGDRWSGVTKEQGGYRIDEQKLERYILGRSAHPDFRPLSYYNLKRAVERESYTYLDRQQTRADLTKGQIKDGDILGDRHVARLMQERGTHLEVHGYGTRERGAVRLNRGARQVLATHEATAWAKQLGERNGKAAKFVLLRNGETLAGKYNGRGRIHSGVAAILENPDKSLSVVLLATDPGAPKKGAQIKLTGGRDVFATAELVQAIKTPALKKSVGGLSL